MSDNTRQKRFVFFVYPKFQVLLLTVNFLTIFFALAFVGYQSLKTYAFMREMAEKANFSKDHMYYVFVNNQEAQAFNNILFAAIISLTVSTIIYLVLSHKLAGPIARLRTYFLELNQNPDAKELKFRKGDFFSELPDIINNALKNYKK